jgi:aspartate/methionine/tyrosine aminotransferase
MFAKRMDQLRFSSSLASIQRIRALRERGVVLHDFASKMDTPAHVKAAAQRYLESPTAALYADPRGIPELRAAIARKLQRENGFTVDPDTEITVTAGGKQGIICALVALVQEGDEVVLEDPGWLSFEPMVRISGATPVTVSLSDCDGFALDVAALRACITPRTRVLVLCNPHNPTGRVLNRAELEAIAAVVQECGLILIMDEAYEHFMFDGHRHVSMAAIDGMRARTITVQTASKTFNMFGWRVGWVVAPPALSEKIQIIAAHSYTCVTSFAQAGAAAALDGTIIQGTLTLPELIGAYETQRNTLVAGLRAIPGVTCVMPAGAYFVFPNFRHFGLASQELSELLFTHAHVSGIAGSVFGQNGEGHLRLVFNAPVPQIEAGVTALQTYLRTL